MQKGRKRKGKGCFMKGKIQGLSFFYLLYCEYHLLFYRRSSSTLSVYEINRCLDRLKTYELTDI
jgi:hypothetical protein